MFLRSAAAELDEATMPLPGVDERIRSSQAKAPVRFEEHSIGWTCSAGYAIGTPDEPISTLLRRAHQALYRAKATGRNRVEAEPLEAGRI